MGNALRARGAPLTHPAGHRAWRGRSPRPEVSRVFLVLFLQKKNAFLFLLQFVPIASCCAHSM